MPLPGRLRVAIVNGDKLVDLDSRRTRRIAGLPANPKSVIGFHASSGDLVVVADQLFLLSNGDTRAHLLAGNISAVTPGQNGMWLVRERSNRKCALTELALTGRPIVPSRPINCDYQLREETARGLIADTDAGEVLLDRRLHVIERSDLISIAGRELITVHGNRINITGRGSARLPETIGEPGGLYVSADNSYLAVEFGNPACPGPRQCLDIWMLRLTTMRWIHPPSMPVSMYLKPHTLFWSVNDRFTWLGTFDGVGAAIATWRPGASALRVRQISLPASQYGVLHT